MEEHLLTCLFKSPNNIQINGFINSFVTLQGKSIESIINESIIKFETIVKPWLKPNGYVDGERISILLKNKFNRDITIPDFRMIELTRAVEPLLIMFGNIIQ